MTTLHALADRIDGMTGGRPGGRVTLEREGPVATIWLDHAEARNAVDLPMIASWARAQRALEAADDVSIILLRARGDHAFCAGGHLGEVVQNLLDDQGARFMTGAMRRLTDGLRSLPAVVVSVVQAPAVGGGAELVTAGDHRVFASTAWAQFRQGPLGVACGWGGAERLVSQVGRATALRWLTTGQRITATEARDTGWAEVVAEEGLDEAVEDFIAPIRALPVRAVRGLKAQVLASEAVAPLLAEARRRDVDEAFFALWGGAEHQAALRAAGRLPPAEDPDASDR